MKTIFQFVSLLVFGALFLHAYSADRFLRRAHNTAPKVARPAEQQPPLVACQETDPFGGDSGTRQHAEYHGATAEWRCTSDPMAGPAFWIPGTNLNKKSDCMRTSPLCERRAKEAARRRAEAGPEQGLPGVRMTEAELDAHLAGLVAGPLPGRCGSPKVVGEGDVKRGKQAARPGQNHDDGAWTVCMDNIPPPADAAELCIIYSIGINYDPSFDVAMDREGCVVFAFDPSTPCHPVKISPSVLFKYIAIGDEDNLGDVCTPSATLPTVLALHGHSEAKLTVLKFDCEGCEWALFAHLWRLRAHGPEGRAQARATLAAFEQVMFEVHFDPAMGWRRDVEGAMYTLLEEAGFRLFSRSINPACWLPAQEGLAGAWREVQARHGGEAACTALHGSACSKPLAGTVHTLNNCWELYFIRDGHFRSG